MPRTTPAARRLAKWRIKVETGATDYSRIVADEDTAKAFADMHTQLAELDTKVGAILDEARVRAHLRASYLTFARELWKIQYKYGNVLPGEVAALITKYTTWGLDRGLLERIAAAVTGASAPAGGITL